MKEQVSEISPSDFITDCCQSIGLQAESYNNTSRQLG